MKLFFYKLTPRGKQTILEEYNPQSFDLVEKMICTAKQKFSKIYTKTNCNVIWILEDGGEVLQKGGFGL